MVQEPKYPGAKTAPFYIGASPICVDANDKVIGDGLFSGHNFKAGEFVAARKRPFIASLETERLKDTCANCFIWTEGAGTGSRLYVPAGTKVQACGGCKRFRYCSKACQKEAWVRGHKYECKNIQKIGDQEVPKAVLACMDLLSQKKHGLIDDVAWDLFVRLDTHREDFIKNNKYNGIMLMSMGASEFSSTADTFDRDYVADMYSRILSNSMTLVTPTYDPLGIMIDEVFCHINHSCDPNAYIVMDGPTLELRMLKDIKVDEEFSISYIDPTNPRSRRQKELKERWFFDCKCSKCQKGAKQKEDVFLKPPKNVTFKVKDLGAELLVHEPHLAKDPANYIGDSRDEQRLAAVQGKIFEEYEKAQGIKDAKEAIKACEDGIALCYQSLIWPQHRQPLPALRDDLIVHMIANEQYEIAFVQCVKRMREVHPISFPQSFHPIRVVQTWQMAMLAQYLASSGIAKEFTPHVDMALVAGLLINTTYQAATISHGPKSAFCLSVKKKLDEVVEDLMVRFESRKELDEALKVQEEYMWAIGRG